MKDSIRFSIKGTTNGFILSIECTGGPEQMVFKYGDSELISIIEKKINELVTERAPELGMGTRAPGRDGENFFTKGER